jgi:thiol-disulfide isomerase/thioredoxin
MPLAQFAVPDARSGAAGDANIAQDDCDAARIPCPSGSMRTPACQVSVPGAIRVCDLFDKPLVLSFWFTRGGDCENQEDVFERAYRRYRDEVNFLAVDVRDSTSEVQKLIRDHHWTHPVGLDRDGALSNLFRVGGCPTFVYAYPGGIMHTTSIGQLDDQQFFAKVEDLIAASQRRAETLR